MIIPTISEIYNTILQDLEDKLESNGFLQKRYTKVFASVQSLKLKTIYVLAAKISNNIFPDTAESELIGGTLERFGRIKLGRNPFTAEQGIYKGDVTGSIGATIKAGTTFTDINNNLFILDAPVTLTATTQSITVRALAGGRNSLLAVNNVITATGPITNVDNELTIKEVVNIPTDAETLDEYRAKILESYRLEPTGGSAADYHLWVEGISGLRKVYPRSGATAGIIDIYIEGTTGVPTSEVTTEVKNVIDLKKPISAWKVNYISVTQKPVVINISKLNIDNPEERNKITKALTDYLYDIRPFVGGVVSPNSVNDTLRDVNMIRAITLAISDNNFFEKLTFTVDGSDVIAYQFVDGNIPELKTINYNS